MYMQKQQQQQLLLVAGASTGKNLGLFCFNEDDAQALLRQVSTVDPPMRDGPKPANPNPFPELQSALFLLDPTITATPGSSAFSFLPELPETKPVVYHCSLLA
ncbi:hypothetical protein HN873_019645 [Arachis hypogaea]